MAIIPVSLLWRGTFGTSYGIGQDYTARKDNGLAFTSDPVLAGGITFDLILDEDHNLVNDVTEHPVEEGSPITDHIRNQLRKGKLTGMVSNYSLFSVVGDNRDSRLQKAYDGLKELWKKRVPVDIVTVLEVYKNVAITNIGMKRNGETGLRQDFEISFKEISIRKLEEVEGVTKINLGDMASLINKQASKKADMGRQVADLLSKTFGGTVPLP